MIDTTLSKTIGQNPVFYTIGYEGLGIQRYLDILAKYGVKTLVDVRHSPSSRNPSFNRKKMQELLRTRGIVYEHRPDMGIPSQVRHKPDAMDWYRKSVVPQISPSLVASNNPQPVCLMCMENDLNSCHRLVIKETLEYQGMSGMDISRALT